MRKHFRETSHLAHIAKDRGDRGERARCRTHDPVRSDSLNVCRDCGKVQEAAGTKFGRPAFWHRPRGHEQERLAAIVFPSCPDCSRIGPHTHCPECGGDHAAANCENMG